MLSEITFGIIGLAIFAYTLQWIISTFDDAREPQRVNSSIPLFGHLLGMLRDGPDYYSTASKATNADIFTLHVLGTKLYISKTHRLTTAIQKSSKTLSFKPFIKTASQKLGGAGDDTLKLFTDDFLDDFSHAMKSTLGPGPDLDAQNMRMGKRVLVDIDELTNGASTVVKLHQWTMHAVVQASSCGVFGEKHPYLDQKVEDAFWTWQSYVLQHFANLDFTRKGYAARETVFKAFKTYCRKLPLDVAPVIAERQRVLLEGGVSEDNAAQQQATFSVAAFANTTPTLYWTIHELYARPDLLAAVRKEVISTAVSGSHEKGFALDVSALKTKCPLTLSVFQETQRTRNIHANIRKVTEDTLLDGKYLLKKGHFLQMPGGPVHHERTTWGPTADTFDPYRFVPAPAVSGQGTKRSVPQSSFISWGAPPHLCPARQFATTEILIVVALLAVRVDIEPMKGEWVLQPPVQKADLVTLHNPKKDVEVRVRRREKWEGKWGLKMGESTTRVSLASG
ncbi:hypothetical protein KVT40_009032 [Elsinoe batatas]|uniref:Cytochrome P450 n=1 Tax=Elsinoe batatas TaxID=2601811 RepID=A0A8K0KU76_9PEZI|nr:hypothetical protein KVT40_009032 [Elsinoe batatas]